ncbi:hypothetical protein ACO0SA_002020 [Hanseniaspora valbyensis]
MSPSHTSKSVNNVPLETNIANLINSTKVFLKALTRWTKKLETQKSISDHYVNLGNDFQTVVKQFTSLGIDMSNMRNVSKELRFILEKALKEEPSNESLDKYWPAIKEIIENLLNTIKLKRIELKKLVQEKEKQKTILNNANSEKIEEKEYTDSKNNSSSESIGSLKLGNSRSESPVKVAIDNVEKEFVDTSDQEIDNEYESANDNPDPDESKILDIPNIEITSELKKEDEPVILQEDEFISPFSSSLQSANKEPNENHLTSSSSTKPSKSKLDPESELKKKKLSKFLSMSGFDDDDDEEEEEEYFDDFSDEDESNDNTKSFSSKLVIKELKNETKIERRASKRYSAYYLSKQSSLQESQEPLPSENESMINEAKISSSSDFTIDSTPISSEPPAIMLSKNLSNEIAQKRNTSGELNKNGDKLSAILKNKMANTHQQKSESKNTTTNSNKIVQTKENVSKKSMSHTNSENNEKARVISPIVNKQPSFITLFLKYNETTIRIETTFPVKTTLENFFAEKFSIKKKKADKFTFVDPKYPGISYDIVNETDALENITDGFIIEFIQDQQKIDTQNNNNNENVIPLDFGAPDLSKVKEIEEENDILRKEVVKMDAKHKEDIAELETKLAHSLSQIAILKKKQVSEAEKNDDLKEVADLKYINNTSTKISSDGDAILNRVDDLQDVIEILRKDVAVRGVKPKTSNLEAIKKELENTQVTLTDFNQFIKDNKPELKSKWEAQLVSICDQQQMLSLQEDLIMDLQSDLEKCKETLDLVILCSEERSKNSKTEGATKKQVLLPLVKPGELNGVRDQLLQDIELLKPDHQSRVEAIEKHEKFNEINK